MAGQHEQLGYYHCHGKLKVGELNRFTITIAAAEEVSASQEHVGDDRLWFRVRNASSMVMRTAYLAGPHILYTSISEQSYRHDRAVEDGHLPPHFEVGLKAHGSRWQDVPGLHAKSCKTERCYVVDICSQIIFNPAAEVEFEFSIGASKDAVRRMAKHHTSAFSADHPALSVQRQTTEDLWDMQPLSPFVGTQVSGDVAIAKAAGLLDNGGLPDETMGGEGIAEGSIEVTETSEAQLQQQIRHDKPSKHLVVLTHGIHSNTTADMLYVKECIEARGRQVGESVVCKGYAGNVCNTERGAKWLGKRLAFWVLRETGWRIRKSGMVRDAENPYTEISFIAHSLGGVVQTYAIGYLHDRTRGCIFRPEKGGLKPESFVALASPLLGIASENPAYVKVALEFGIIGKTGMDLALSPKPMGQYDVHDVEAAPGEGPRKVHSTRPLLLLMSLPVSSCHRAMRLFERRTVYANTVNDGIVPLRTSSLYFLDWHGINRAQKAQQAEGQAATDQELCQTVDGGRSQPSPVTDPSSTSMMRTETSSASNGCSSDVHSDTRSLFAVTSEPSSPMREHFPADLSLDTLVDDRHSQGTSQPDTARDEEERHFGDDSKSESPNDESTDAKGMSDDHKTRKQTSSLSFATLAHAVTALKHLKLSVNDKKSPTQHSAAARAGTASNSPTEVSSRESPISGLVSMLRPAGHHAKPRSSKAFLRSQTIPADSKSGGSGDTRGQDSGSDGESDIVSPPPRTSFLKALEAVVNPPMPELDLLADPSKRPTDTIVHDRVYKPTDIPPLKREKAKEQRLQRAVRKKTSKSSLGKEKVKNSSSEVDGDTSPTHDKTHETSTAARNGSTGGTDRESAADDVSSDVVEESIRMEERVARNWHADMTWRKVLVKLPPDAHNNIVVRRRFANSYGWPVVDHLVLHHFGPTTDEEADRGIVGVKDGERQ